MLARVRRLATFDERFVWWPAFILLVLAARVGWAAWIAHAHPTGVTAADSASYLGPARALVDTGHFHLSPGDATPIFFRTPGYPTVLAAILWVTNSQWAISPIQAGLSVVIIVVTALIGGRIIGPAAGVVAGVIVALDPLQFALSGTILTESVSSLIVVGVVAVGAVVFVRRPERVHWLYLVAFGGLLAVATMVRPTMWFYPLIAVILLALRFRRLPASAVLALLFAFALPIVVVVGGWQLRNHYAVHSWEVSGVAGYNLYCFDGAAVEANTTGQSIYTVRARLGCDRNGAGVDPRTGCPPFWNCNVKEPLANGPGFDKMGSKGLRTLVQHPVQTARDELTGEVREVAGPGTDTVSRYLHVRASVVLAAPLFVWNVLLWSLAAVGAVVGLRSRLRAFWAFVVSLVVYVIVVSGGAASYARFRAPIVPLLALLAALGTRSVYRRVIESRRAAPSATLTP